MKKKVIIGLTIGLLMGFAGTVYAGTQIGTGGERGELTPTPIPTNTPTPVPTNTPTPMPTNTPTPVPTNTPEIDSVLNNLVPEISDFSLHSGTMFNDSISEIKKKEEAAGYSVADEWSGYENPNKYVLYEGMFAGISNSSLRYAFYGNGGLYNSHYLFNTYSQFEYANQKNDFTTITNELIKKYGNPIFTGTSGIPFYLFEYNEDNTVTGWGHYSISKALDDSADMPDYNQWLIKVNDYYVLIDHYLLQDWSSSSYAFFFSHYLCYTCLDEQMVIDTLKLYFDTENARVDSLSNDL